MNITRGLIVDQPWIGYILDGSRRWEMRSRPTSFRGWFGLIAKGSGAISAVAQLVDSGAALSDAGMIAAHDMHRIPEASVRDGSVDRWRFPWMLAEVRSLQAPVPYRHRNGAVTWVRFDPDVSEAIARMLVRGGGPDADANQGDMMNPRQIVFSSLETTREALLGYVTNAAATAFGSDWEAQLASGFRHWRAGPDGHHHFDVAKLLQVMDRFWNELFRSSLDRSHRSIVNELADVRNRVAHDVPISDEDAERALDSMRRLLLAIGAMEASARISQQRDAMLRARYARPEPAALTRSRPAASSDALPTQAENQPRRASGQDDRVSRREVAPEGSAVVGEITITQGNIDHNHMYLRSLFDRFPDDAKGGSNKALAAGRTLTVNWGGPGPVETDLDGQKKFFRARGWIGAFYKLNGARAGDRVRIEEAAPYCYRVTLVR